MLTPLIVVSIICIIIIAPCASSNLTVFDDRRYDRPTPAWLLKPFDNDSRRLFEYMTVGDGVGEAYEWLAELVDTFGHRMVGSRALEDAIDYLVDKLKRDGFDNVHTEAVDELPNWVRGEEDRVELIG
jgi:carboxypeptidase Q